MDTETYAIHGRLKSKRWLVDVPATDEGMRQSQEALRGLMDEAAARLRVLSEQNRAYKSVLEHAKGLPGGEWSVWTSNSCRRISHLRDGDILQAVVHSDGCPDLSWNEEICQALCDLINGIRAMEEAE